MGDAVNAAEFCSLVSTEVKDDLIELIRFCKYVFDGNTSYRIKLLIELVWKKRIDEDIIEEIKDLLICVYDRCPDADIQQEYKTDLCYHANMLAGALHATIGEGDGDDTYYEKWKSYSESEDQFNDVRVGMERGELYVS
jgi:hypothetical protein